MISKEKLEDIMYRVLNEIEEDIESDGYLADFEAEIILRSANQFYSILKDRVYDYIEFGSDENE